MLETPLTSAGNTSASSVQPSEWLSYTQLLTTGTEDQIYELVRLSEMTVPGASEVCELTEVKAQIRQQRVILEKMLQEIEGRECAELAKEKEAFEKQHHVDKLFSRYTLRAKGGG